MDELRPGLMGTARIDRVSEADLAVTLGSGDLRVLGTPRVLALVERAAVAAVAEVLPEGATTVGTAASIRHLAPTPEGGWVLAKATLEVLDGRRLVFRVDVLDAAGTIAQGEHERAVVDAVRFLERATARASGSTERRSEPG